MRNLKLTIEYDGTNFVGWQRQENGRSVQGTIEAALSQLLQQNATLTGAGRTDAGVHARGQVAHVTIESVLSAFEIQGGLNGLLPDEIVVHDVQDAPINFHARYSARERQYSYLISRRPIAIMRLYSWLVNYKLDLDAMQRAAGLIRGEHNFESFCTGAAEIKHHQCTIREATWIEDDLWIRFVVSADRFLHGMVRALVGTMIDVGRDHTSINEFAAILEAKDRKKAGMAAPARGLVLERVLY